MADWPPVNAEPFLSAGHAGGTWKVDVHVSPASRAEYQTLVTGMALPVGTWVAKFHRDDKTGNPGPVFAMHKTRDGWEYLVAEATGAVQERGALDLCQRCHSEGVADQLFGLGRRRPSRDAGTD